MAVRWHRPTRAVNMAIQQIQADQMVSSCDRNKLMGMSPYVLGLVLMWCVCFQVRPIAKQLNAAVCRKYCSDWCDEISKILTCIWIVPEKYCIRNRLWWSWKWHNGRQTTGYCSAQPAGNASGLVHFWCEDDLPSSQAMFWNASCENVQIPEVPADVWPANFCHSHWL